LAVQATSSSTARAASSAAETPSPAPYIPASSEADSVAWDSDDEGVQRFLSEMEVLHKYGYDGGYEVEIETAEALTWLKANRPDVYAHVVELALEHPDRSPRQISWLFTDQNGYFISESSVFRILKRFDLVESPAFRVLSAADKFKHPTQRVHELWQTDFTYLKVIGWGWYYLSTVLDDYSRYIIAWKLCTTMKADDVTATLELALDASGLDKASVLHRPRLLSDNGSSYISDDLAKWMTRHAMAHVRGAPYHPMTQGKIERWHQTLKNRILLENYYLPPEGSRCRERRIPEGGDRSGTPPRRLG